MDSDTFPKLIVGVMAGIILAVIVMSLLISRNSKSLNNLVSYTTIERTEINPKCIMLYPATGQPTRVWVHGWRIVEDK